MRKGAGGAPCTKTGQVIPFMAPVRPECGERLVIVSPLHKYESNKSEEVITVSETVKVQANISIIPYNLEGVDRERAFRDILDVHNGNLEGVHGLIEMEIEGLDDFYEKEYPEHLKKK